MPSTSLRRHFTLHSEEDLPLPPAILSHVLVNSHHSSEESNYCLHRLLVFNDSMFDSEPIFQAGKLVPVILGPFSLFKSICFPFCIVPYCEIPSRPGLTYNSLETCFLQLLQDATYSRVPNRFCNLGLKLCIRSLQSRIWIRASMPLPQPLWKRLPQSSSFCEEVASMLGQRGQLMAAVCTYFPRLLIPEFRANQLRH